VFSWMAGSIPGSSPGTAMRRDRLFPAQRPTADERDFCLTESEIFCKIFLLTESTRLAGRPGAERSRLFDMVKNNNLRASPEAAGIFLIFFARNPLKSLDSEK
jgi:hypothetical protein